METYGVSENAIFMPGTTDPQFSRWLAFSGTSVTLDDKQHYLDSHLSYQRACLRHRLPHQVRLQPYPGLHDPGFGADRGRLSGVVDIPNSCSTVYIPTEIFDIDIRPSAKGPAQIEPGMDVLMAAPTADPRSVSNREAGPTRRSATGQVVGRARAASPAGAQVSRDFP